MHLYICRFIVVLPDLLFNELYCHRLNELYSRLSDLLHVYCSFVQLASLICQIWLKFAQWFWGYLGSMPNRISCINNMCNTWKYLLVYPWVGQNTRVTFLTLTGRFYNLLNLRGLWSHSWSVRETVIQVAEGSTVEWYREITLPLSRVLCVIVRIM